MSCTSLFYISADHSLINKIIRLVFIFTILIYRNNF
nr:MAG TPA: hypothetical protein [Caudoviricetes sp.]